MSQTMEKLLLEKEDAAQQARLKAAAAEHQARKNRIAQLMSDSSECFEAEIDVIERSRSLQHQFETERHREASSRIDADCDRLREDIIARHLAKLDEGATDSASAGVIEAAPGEDEVTSILAN